MKLVRTRFTTKVGASAQRIGTFCNDRATVKAVARVASSVAAARTTSTSGIADTGLKKCSPTTRPGCWRPAAMPATESPDVFVTRRHSGRTCFSASARTDAFTSARSTTASITRSASARSASSVLPLTIASMRAAVPGVMRRRATVFRTFSATPSIAASTRSASTSTITTGTWSRRANNTASCRPMSPPPITPTFVTARADDGSGAPAGRLARRCVRSNA